VFLFLLCVCICVLRIYLRLSQCLHVYLFKMEVATSSCTTYSCKNLFIWFVFLTSVLVIFLSPSLYPPPTCLPGHCRQAVARSIVRLADPHHLARGRPRGGETLHERHAGADHWLFQEPMDVAIAALSFCIIIKNHVPIVLFRRRYGKLYLHLLFTPYLIVFYQSLSPSIRRWSTTGCCNTVSPCTLAIAFRRCTFVSSGVPIYSPASPFRVLAFVFGWVARVSLVFLILRVLSPMLCLFHLDPLPCLLLFSLAVIFSDYVATPMCH
jgi:hypothetical protein